MRFIKPIFTLIILALIVAFIWQNLPIFNAPVHFGLSFYFGQPFQWVHSTATLLGISALIGFLVGFGALLKPYLNLRKKLAEGQQAEKEPPQQQQE